MLNFSMTALFPNLPLHHLDSTVFSSCCYFSLSDGTEVFILTPLFLYPAVGVSEVSFPPGRFVLGA